MKLTPILRREKRRTDEAALHRQATNNQANSRNCKHAIEFTYSDFLAILH